METAAKTLKLQARVPAEIHAEVAKIAEERFDGRLTDALVYVVSVGLETLLGRPFDTGLADKAANDDVGAFREEYLLKELGLEPRYATTIGSTVRSAIRSGDPRAYVEDPEVDQRIRWNREGAWRHWSEYCLVNNMDPVKVRVAAL